MAADCTLRHDSPPEAKIARFRSLFRGREDVYARRFESRKTGKSGYQPACVHEWVRGLCEKPQVKCGVCPQRRFLPVTDQVIHQHLSGKDEAGHDLIMGLYPMLPDESCFLLVADFDKSSWQDDAAAFRETCRSLGLPVALERSRSGNGGHLWLVFSGGVTRGAGAKVGLVHPHRNHGTVP